MRLSPMALPRPIWEVPPPPTNSFNPWPNASKTGPPSFSKRRLWNSWKGSIIDVHMMTIALISNRTELQARNEAPKSLQRPPNKPTDLTWQCIGLSGRPTTHKLNLQEWRQISAKMSPLSAVDVQKRHRKETQKLSYPSSLLWLNVCISGVFSLFVVLFLFHFREFYFLLFHLFIHVLPFHGCSLDR